MVNVTSIKRRVLLILMIILFSSSILVACGSTKEPVNTPTSEPEVTTSKEAETTTEEITTEEESTTEEETTDSRRCISIYPRNEELYNSLEGKVIKKGDKISVNDFFNTDDSFQLARYTLRLYEFLGMDKTYLYDQFGGGSEEVIIHVEDNYVFEYTGDKTYVIEKVGCIERENGGKLYTSHIYEIAE